MPRTLVLIAIGAALAAASAPARAQEPSERPDHAIVYEIGWAGTWSQAEGFRPVGGTLAFEVTPIEHWLELEIGATAIRADRGAETSVDLLFKKPWSISPGVELMAGIGPELIRASGAHAIYPGLSAVLDAMFWPKPNVGWYAEPGFEATFPHGEAKRGFAFAAGILLGR